MVKLYSDEEDFDDNSIFEKMHLFEKMHPIGRPAFIGATTLDESQEFRRQRIINNSTSTSRPENKPWVVDAIESGRGAVSTTDGKEVTGWIDLEDAFLIAAAPDLLEALRDMLAGWVYIRETYGDLYGVGWDRAQDKANAAIAKARL
jgi:hypothetical protein